MYAVDLHTHTRFFHGFDARPTPFDPVGARLSAAVARREGLDGVAFTNHDYAATPRAPGVTAIPGIEITTSLGHVLVVGPDPPRVTNPGVLTPAEVVELAHDGGCAAVVAHPYRNSTVREDLTEFDAVEVNGKHPRTRAWAERLAAEHDLPVVGGSDAHYPVEVGRAYTAVDADRLTPASVVAAIRDGRVEPRVDDGPAHRLVRRAYRYVHGEKAHLQRPDWVEPTPGVGTPPGPR